MSNGTGRKTFRLSPDLLARVDRQRESLRWRSPYPPTDLTDIVRRALEDWLAKYERSARHRRPRKGSGKPKRIAAAASDTASPPAAVLEGMRLTEVA